MNAADDTELRRLCEHLSHIGEHAELSTSEHESLQKAGLALHLVFLRGFRAEIERTFECMDLPPTDSQLARLSSLGIVSHPPTGA